jgi:replication initiation protein RepC
LAEVVDTCKEYRAFFPAALRDWRDFMDRADQISRMLGIDAPVMTEAKRIMGGQSAAVTWP